MTPTTPPVRNMLGVTTCGGEAKIDITIKECVFMEINWNWGKVWRIALLAVIVVAVAIYCIAYFKTVSVWAGVSTIAAFVAGAVGGYLVRGLKDEFRKDK